ncbi:hypothetical protein [Leptospira kanakyensis]|uniref:AbiJ N-terminal domain-containing protein n=1 Tax=Leptospira kanakyensis TaxID=2484968 RepID=A0A6N4QLU5_9LEPT|nr:hypothetical protein [Leptospira kanakyensis]TGK55734.1 hypothetical protein EHQ11_00085 [Leptospira kanakyensis]TGK76989.1 hypothetical protein EHQ18_00055 [Leptospira kanakyensis]
MEIKKPILNKLAEMVCGNAPFTHFPYRSSSYLTKFFLDLDLDFKHDGSTRSYWVENVLSELNKDTNKNQNLPSQELIKVIESLVDPDKFLFNEKLDINKARDDLNKILKLQDLKILVLQNGQARLISQNENFISTDKEAFKDSEELITFRPSVFKIPKKPVNERQIAVMMPFNPGFKGTYDAIKRVSEYLSLECYRADDIWENTTFMQDIFELIFCSSIIIVDYSQRNPNVMYETGIAHTLGKTVIPITQSLDDIPSDLGHHRALKYLPNDEGYRNLSNELYKRIKTILEL